MKPKVLTSAAALAALLLAGCASSGVSERKEYQGELTRPDRIIVHDFAGTPDDVPDGSAIAGLYSRRDTPQSPEEIALGRDLGARVAAKLVEDLRAMGMPAERAAAGPPPAPGDGVIMGEFVTIDEGDQLKRMLIGFGAGAAELKTLVEGFQMTESGLVPLGSAEIEAGGGKMPGMLVPVGVGAATGNIVTSTAVSGGLNVAQELGPESLEAAAERTAGEISKLLEESFQKRGWI